MSFLLHTKIMGLLGSLFSATSSGGAKRNRSQRRGDARYARRSSAVLSSR